MSDIVVIGYGIVGGQVAVSAAEGGKQSVTVIAPNNFREWSVPENPAPRELFAMLV